MKTTLCTLLALLVSGQLAAKTVTYEQFGAKGDGKSDDRAAIVAAHAHANKIGASVRAKDGAVYFIGKGAETATVKTDVDFGKAKFIIDDVDIPKLNSPLFRVEPTGKEFKITEVKSLRRDQKTIGMKLPCACLVHIQDSNIRRYIRLGLNQNNGTAQQETIIVDKNGRIDPSAPLLWDYPEVTAMTAYPIDPKKLTIRGGHFTTIANQRESKYTYHTRGFVINRSNVEITSISHDIIGELDHGAPYASFIGIQFACNVTVSDCVLTGHRTYMTIGSAKRPVPMGSYELGVNNSIGVSVVNCRQTNDINDRRYWGIFASNYCKNLLFDKCEFSRFDAHMGVYNATILNSRLGYMGIHAIGAGVFTVENTTVYANEFFELRPDYGSTWEGEFIVRNCRFVPANGRKIAGCLVMGRNSGMHDFGYTCHMPAKIVFDGLEIDDSSHPDKYSGPFIFSNFNPERRDDTYQEKFPYVLTREVVLKNVTTKSGKSVNLSPNGHMFKDVKVTKK